MKWPSLQQQPAQKAQHVRGSNCTRGCEGVGGGGVDAAAFNLTLRFSTRHHLHRRSVMERCAIPYLPKARPAGFSCAAAACNDVGEAISLAFARHSFDLPHPIAILHDYSGVAALAVQRVAAAHFARAIIAAVYGASIDTGRAGDEEAIACARGCSGRGSCRRRGRRLQLKVRGYSGRRLRCSCWRAA